MRTGIIRTYLDGTDGPDEFSYNFSLSNDLTKIVNFLAWIPHCDSVLLFFSSDAIFSTVAFLRNSHHTAVSVSIDFPSNSKGDVPFHCKAYDILVLTKTVFVII